MAAPVFIVSCARSGSTLLRLAMNAHPQVWSPPELHLLTLCQRLMWTEGVLRDDGVGDDAFWQGVAARVREQVDAIIAPPLAASGKEVFCEKSVTSVNHLDMLKAVFPDARVVLLYRHAADMVDSGLRAIAERADGFDFEPYLNAFPHSRLEALTRYWLEKTATLRSVAQPAASVRYEDLVDNPQAALTALATALELPGPDDWADAIYRSPPQQGPGDASAYKRTRVDTGSVGVGQAQPWSTLPRRLVKKVNQQLAELGYAALPS
ncbi:MAG: sulfotransferase [Pseudomonadota bacterium]